MIDTLLTSLWRASWQGAVVVAALWCFCRVFEARRWLSADLRCWLWRGAYVKLLLGLFIVASVALPLLPPHAPVAGLPEVGGNTANQERVAFVGVPLSPAQRPATSETMGNGTVENGSPVKWQTALASLYLLGVGVCVFRVGQKGLATRRVLKEAALKNAGADDAAIKVEIARFALLFGLRHAPRLLRSPNTFIPCYAKGTVLLPAHTNYTAPEMRLVLAHELAHAKRCDLAWEWLGTLAQIAFFFHPLVWLARREERLCREAAADALALHVTQARAADYGTLLLRFSLARAHQSLAGVVGIVDRGTLFRRRLLCLGEDFSMTGSGNSVRRGKQIAASAALIFAVSAAVFVPWNLQARAQTAETPQEKAARSENRRIQEAFHALTAKEENTYQKALSNAKQLGTAFLMLAADNDGVYKTTPNTARKDVGYYLEHNRMDKNAFTSPLDKPGTQSFKFNYALQNVPQKKIKDPLNTVMVYEGAWGKPLFRYNGVALIVFAEGHAKRITPAQAKDLIWTPQAKGAGKRAQGVAPRKAAWNRAWTVYETQKQRQKEAVAAVTSGDTQAATRLAQQLLTNNTDAHDWNYGNIVHDANQILGLVALQEGRTDEAKRLLIVAGNTPGSPQLGSFGPNMVLAQRLLDKGEKETVIQYLDLVARFWAHTPEAELARVEKYRKGAAALARSLNQAHGKQIAFWKQQITDGDTPMLNMSKQLY